MPFHCHGAEQLHLPSSEQVLLGHTFGDEPSETWATECPRISLWICSHINAFSLASILFLIANKSPAHNFNWLTAALQPSLQHFITNSADFTVFRSLAFSIRSSQGTVSTTKTTCLEQNIFWSELLVGKKLNWRCQLDKWRTILSFVAILGR